MRVRNDEFITHQGNLTPQRVQEMEFDQDSIAHLMSVLTDLYSDQALAVIREYSTNGLDSHRAAGISDPIEVELPSQMKPVFVVRDHGIGMSVDDITERFSKYGYSSKRDNDDEVGMLGLGCKSGLTYTNQFTLTAVKGGVKTTALITRNADGKGVVQIIDTIGTDERNGVEIQVPAKAPIHDFTRKAETFFSFWEPGTVLVNGQPPTSYFDGENKENLFLDDDILVVKEGLHTDYIVMGNVAYPAEIDHGYKAKVIARVAIGEVNFVPSREALQMTSRTVTTIETVKTFVQDRLEHHIQREIDAAPSKREAAMVALRWDELVHNYRNRPKYRGEKIPQQIKMTGQSWTPSSYNDRASDQTYINMKDLVRDGYCVLVNHPSRSMIKQTKQSIKQHYPNCRHLYVIHTIEKEHIDWLAVANLIDYDEIKPPKMARVAGQRNANGRYLDGGGRWLVWSADDKFITEDIPADTDVRLVYLMKSESGKNAENTRDTFRRKMGEFLAQLADPFKLVLLSAGEEERFKKLYPGAVHAPDFFQLHIDAIMAELTEDQFWWGDRHDWRLQLVDEAILDPDSVALFARMKACVGPRAVRLNQELIATWGRAYHVAGENPEIRGRPLPSGYNRGLADIREQSKSDLKQQMEHHANVVYPLANNYKVKESLEYFNATYLYRKGDCK